MNINRTLLACLLLGVVINAWARETTKPNAPQDRIQPPKLQPVFRDDFSHDTRGDYKIDRNVSWEKGKLTLAENASIAREINGGVWAKVELNLELPKLTRERPKSELRVWFILDGATNCYVRLQRQLRNGKFVGSVALVDTGEEDGKSIEHIVRDQPMSDTEIEALVVEYRYGLIKVAVASKPILTAQIENGASVVAGSRMDAVTGNLKLSSFLASSTEPPVVLTPEQQQQLVDAEAAIHDLTGFYKLGNFDKAAEVRERVQKTKMAAFGKQHPSYAVSLINLATLCERMGDYAPAETLYKEASAILKVVLGEDHPDYAAALNNLALLYGRLGEYALAEPLYRQALEIDRSMLGELHPSYANILNNLAMLYFHTSDYASAEQLYKQALEIKSVLGKQHPSYAMSLNNLAALYYRMGDYTRAVPLFRLAMTIRESALGKQHPLYAQSRNNLATLYESMGDFTRAQPLFEEAMEIRRSLLGEHHPDYAESLSSLAGLYKRMDHYAQAEPLYMQALEINKSALRENHPNYATSLNKLGELYRAMGDYARAEPLLREALEIRKSVLGEEHPNYASSINNLAALYNTMGDHARAEPLFNQALKIRKSAFGEQHELYAASLNNLAGLYENMDHYARAEPIYKQASTIWKSVLGDQHPNYAASLNNLAVLYHRQGDYATAEPLYKEASAIWKSRSIQGAPHPEYTTSLNNLAGLYHSMGDYARAEPLYERASADWKSLLGEYHPHYATSLNNLAGLYESMGDYALAEPLTEKASSIVRRNLDQNSIVQSERQQKRNQATKRFFLDNRLANSLLSFGDATTTLQDLWRWKGAVTASQQAYRRVASMPKIEPLFTNLKSISRQVSTISGRAPLPPAQDATGAQRTAYQQKREIWERQLADLTRKREDLEQRIASAREEFRHIREPLTVKAVRDWLPDGTAYVDFLEYNHITPDPKKKGTVKYERRNIAFIVTRNRPPAMVGLGPAESLAQAISTFRHAFLSQLNTNKNRFTTAKAAQQIRADLWLPIEAHLQGIETVIISPDTALGTLPFAALAGRKSDSFLIEDYKLASLPFAKFLPHLMERKAASSSEHDLLLLGDVDYDSAAQSRPASDAPKKRELANEQGHLSRTRGYTSNRWESLSGFRDELEIVMSLHKRRFGTDSSISTMSGTDATEDTLLRKALHFHTLHLITHGFFSNPGVRSIDQAEIEHDGLTTRPIGPDPFMNTWSPGLLSGLVMAGANRPSGDPEDLNDGILRASEIEAASMQGVDLVVLSACETGLGAVAGGEGLTGLQRAFQIAGARSVVASLWKVDDRATQELMRQFYTNLWVKKQSKIDALRNAQLYILKNPVLADGTRLTRGKPTKIATPDPNAKPRASGRTDPYFWAAWTLSGDWR